MESEQQPQGFIGIGGESSRFPIEAVQVGDQQEDGTRSIIFVAPGGVRTFEFNLTPGAIEHIKKQLSGGIETATLADIPEAVK